MQRVERHIIKDSNPAKKQIDKLCFLSKNLYNYCNFIYRQDFFKGHKIPSAYALMKQLRKEKQVDYTALPIQTSQQVIFLLEKNWKSFFKALKAFAIKPEAFLGRPKLPKYKHKVNGRNAIIFTNQQIRLKDGTVYFPAKAGLHPIKTKADNICQVRIVPEATCYIIEVVYNKEAQNVPLKFNNFLSIDMGINNLATCTNNMGLKPFVINGRPLKSMNQYYNKKKSLLMSFVGNKGSSNRIIKLTRKRNNKVNDYMHKASRFIIDYCVKYQIGTIIIGKNPEWKQEVSIGKRNNQNFVCIPHDKFVKQIIYKAEEFGINAICQGEAYTSKCSFLDSEQIEKHEQYSGRRITRGLFLSALGIKINADVNGSLNILRKVVPDAFCKGIEGVGLHPIKIINFNKGFV